MRNYFLCIIALLLVLPASAKNDAYVEDLEHDWGSVEAPVSIAAPLEWKEIHGRLGSFGDIDAFSFNFAEPFDAWSIEVQVPECGAHFEAVYPSIAVIGTGLPRPENLASIPVELANNQGAVILQAGERPSPRTRDMGNQFNFFYQSPDASFYTYYYQPERLYVDIPNTGDYTLLVWEPDGHVGAYMLWVGNQHPDDMGQYRDMSELEAAFTQIGTGEWMGQDCEAPLNETACPAALEATAAIPQLDFPERSELGEASILIGKVYDAATCLPLAGVEIDYELADDSGEVSESNTGTIFTNQQGAYRVANATRGTNIRLYLSAEGYAASMVEQLLEVGVAEPQLDISLATGS
jgi:hypothetical protein